MAKRAPRPPRRRGFPKRRLAVIALLALAVGVGGYYALDRLAQSRAETALTKFQRQLPKDTGLTYTSLDARFFDRSATLRNVVFRQGDRRVRAKTATVADAARTSGGDLRAGTITASGITARTAAGLGLDAGTVRLSDVRMAAGGGTLRSLGKARVDTAAFTRGEASVRISDLTVTGATPRRIGRITAGIVEIDGITQSGGDREVLRNLRVDGLDIAGLPPLRRAGELDSGDVAAAVRRLDYDALELRQAEMFRDDQRRLLLRGFTSRRDGDAEDKRAWTTGVDHFRIRVDPGRVRLPNVLDEDDMLRGRAGGRQVYDPQAGTLALTDLTLAVEGAGRLTGDILVDGLPKNAASGTTVPAGAHLEQAKVAKLDVTYTDEGVLERALSALATRAGVSRDELIERRLGALTTRAREAPREIRQSVEALAAFARNGGKLRLRMAPAQSVAISQAVMGFAIRPIRTAQMLNLELSRP